MVAPWSSRPRDIIDRRTAAGVTITLTNSNQFQPGTLTVARGTTVTWVNTGFAPHTVTDDASKAAKPTDALRALIELASGQ